MKGSSPTVLCERLVFEDASLRRRQMLPGGVVVFSDRAVVRHKERLNAVCPRCGEDLAHVVQQPDRLSGLLRAWPELSAV